MNKKTGVDVWLDFARDLLGVDRGYVYTLKSVYQRPTEVVESYFNDRGKYLSPFTLLGISFAIYYLISGLLVDWDSVSDGIKAFYRAFGKWMMDMQSTQPDTVKTAKLDDIFNRAIVPMVDTFVLGLSTYLVLVLLPLGVIILYATSLFTRRIGIGFYYHFVSLSYYLSFSLLFYDTAILVSLVNIWLIVPYLILFNYFFYGHMFKSYGANSHLVKVAFMKGMLTGMAFIMVLGMVIGLAWGAMLR
jgi:hypothetical protein